MRLTFRAVLIILSALTLFHGAALLAADRPPNIVFLLTDDHPYNAYGFMGSDVAHTPNIDRLAAQSARFVNGYAPSSVCRPSLGVLLTGLYPHDSGIWFNRSPQKDDDNAAHLIADLPSLPRLLRQRGYASLQTGKHWEGSYAQAGFDEGTTTRGGWNGVVRDGKKIGRETLEPIYDFVNRQVADDRPFFIWYGVYLPHAPANAPQMYRDLFQGKGLAEHEVAYHANIAWLDDSIGRLMAFFDSKGLTDNTIFVLLSDNGMTIHPDPWWGGAGGKTSTGEMGLRTPILLRWDGRVKPATHHQLVSTIDFVPTMLAAAGVKTDHAFPGENLIELAKQDRPTDARAVFGELYNPNPLVDAPPAQAVSYRWVRKGDWKLIVPENLDRRDALHRNWPKINDVKASDHFTEPRLFNVAEDPHEQRNLADDPTHRDTQRELKALLDDWWPVSTKTARAANTNAAAAKPNVLFIAIDDMNDWIGALGGHPDAKTPHIDRLAQRGMLFANAHCAAPVCNPSRTATLTGLRPSTTGCYMNADWALRSPVAHAAITLPEHFRTHGYKTLTAGKIVHASAEKAMLGDERAERVWDANGGSFGGQSFRVIADDFPHPFKDLAGVHNFALHWGGLEGDKAEELSDPKVAAWAADQLAQRHDKPFFLAVGFHRPHTPLTSPRAFYEMFDRDKVALPPVRDGDLDDMPWMGRQVAIGGYQEMQGGHYRQITERGHWRDVVRAYLAACTFVDAQVGKVLDALDRSPHRDNTIVVLWSDHGWGLGERYHFKKWGLWDDTTRVPFVIAAPGVTDPGTRSSQGVSLLDIYPTLVDLCGLPQPAHTLDGRTLRPLLERPDAKRDEPAVITFGPNNHALRTDRWRYIRWADGSEELYDHADDVHEWRNVADEAQHAELKAQLRRWLPRDNVNAVTSAPPPADVYHLKPGQTINTYAVQPGVARRSITLRARVHASKPDGVVLVHAGMFVGYALYVKDGRLCVAVRDVPRPVNWNRLDPSTTIIRSEHTLPDRPVDAVARLHADGRLTLHIDGQLAAEGRCAGTLSMHPAGQLRTAGPVDRYPPVGDYPPDAKFRGTLDHLAVGYGESPDFEASGR